MERLLEDVQLQHAHEPNPISRILCIASNECFRQSQFEYYIKSKKSESQPIFTVVNSLFDLTALASRSGLIDELIVMVHGNSEGELIFGHDTMVEEDVRRLFRMSRDKTRHINIRMLHCYNHMSETGELAYNRSLQLNYHQTTSSEVPLTFNIPQYLVDDSKPKDDSLRIHTGLNPEVMKIEAVEGYIKHAKRAAIRQQEKKIGRKLCVLL
jgi:hypothetical protein